jgi:hypothetical protein
MRLWAFGVMVIGMIGLAGCRPSDILDVPPPANVLGSGALQNQSGAELVFNGGKTQLFSAAYGSRDLVELTGMMTDELEYSGAPFTAALEANYDARITAPSSGPYQEFGDVAWKNLLQARSSLLASVPGLVAYEPSAGRSKIGEAYALTGYAELLIAESFCAGTPLTDVAPGGVVHYGMPLTTDSILRVAIAHFDSAAAESHGDATMRALAAVGKARALLDEGQFADAAAAVQAVPTSFVYNGVLAAQQQTGASLAQTNFWASALLDPTSDHGFAIGDHDGGNGLDFVSAHDPRLVLDSIGIIYHTTAPWYLPHKFTLDDADVPLATGIEARLIEAEAALQGNSLTQWLSALNVLRNAGCTVSGSDTTCALGTGVETGQTVGLPDLADPGTDSSRVSLLFRERAFWLFGTGTRLGDLRRLVRQYGRDQARVFPSGPYAALHPDQTSAPITSFGSDVTLTLPTPRGLVQNGISETNPNYKGCISPTSQA